MCLNCGSFGKLDDNQVIACSQCGQCYHTYCADTKVCCVMLEKGWRCLDCTVCEGCGKATDEGRLLLCDDCDISYHIYCLTPPLEHVPKGNWKCKWCVKCLKCGSKTPGKENTLEWKNNYTECAICFSLTNCHICEMNYKESDSVVKCTHCDR
jgi:histone-lysine N-methyltransferase MLL3